MVDAVPFIVIVRGKAQKAGLILRKKGPTYTLHTVPKLSVVMKSKDIHEVNEWLEKTLRGAGK